MIKGERSTQPKVKVLYNETMQFFSLDEYS